MFRGELLSFRGGYRVVVVVFICYYIDVSPIKNGGYSSQLS